jgi:uncharacterized membrane-anchored protein
MKSPLTLCLLAICLLIFPSVATASKKAGRAPKEESTKPQPTEEELAMQAFEAKLNFQRGKIVLPGGLATLDVPDSFRYLAPEQTDMILVEAWGNPPGRKTLGMLFPSDVSPLKEGGWGVVITYQEDGHVADDEASTINYGELMEGMQEETAEANEERQQQGYEPIRIVGWAAPPRYDQASHKLYWAKELEFGGSPEHTLNYDIRMLGREGVLSFNAVASMNQVGGD